MLCYTRRTSYIKGLKVQKNQIDMLSKTWYLFTSGIWKHLESPSLFKTYSKHCSALVIQVSYKKTRIKHI